MSPIPPGQPLDGGRPTASTPSVPLGPAGIAEVGRAPGSVPGERRQPQVRRRSVVPVEWFRRMPGGGTTYAPEPAPDAG